MGGHRTRALPNAADLRRSFDQTFLEPARPPASDLEMFLAIRVAAQPFALRIRELSRLEPARSIAPIPDRPAALLGVAGIQGRLTPVYRLATVLGMATTPAYGWIAVCSGEEPLGLAFEEFERVLQVPQTELIQGSGPEGTGALAQQVIRGTDAIRPVLHLSSVRAAVWKLAGISGNVSKG